MTDDLVESRKTSSLNMPTFFSSSEWELFNKSQLSQGREIQRYWCPLALEFSTLKSFDIVPNVSSLSELFVMGGLLRLSVEMWKPEPMPFYLRTATENKEGTKLKNKKREHLKEGQTFEWSSRHWGVLGTRLKRNLLVHLQPQWQNVWPSFVAWVSFSRF